jgi:dolichol-phosphate mannosyltransferase
MENSARTSLIDGRGISESPQTCQSTKTEKYLVVLDAYNELSSISHIIKQIQSHALGPEILVVDYHSHNGTADKIKHSTNFGEKVHVMKRPCKNGTSSGFLHKEVLEWAVLQGYDAVVEMNADLSHDPVDISKLLNALNGGNDLAVGSRYLHGVRVLNWPQSRLWISSLAGWYIRLLSGLSMTDPTSEFKAIRRRVLEEMNWQKLNPQGDIFQFELYFFAWQAGFKIVEVPIVYTEREEGNSKMSAHIAIQTGIRVLQLALRRVFP